MTDRYRVYGVNPSPYSVKLRAILRYRRLPFDWIPYSHGTGAAPLPVKVPVVPVLQLPDSETYLVDSTPIAHALEARHPQARSILPGTAAAAFVCDLIEDFADEWLTKVMFHYRWAYADSAAFVAPWAVAESMPELAPAERAMRAQQFAERQIGRMALVGCTPQTAPILEASFLRLLDAFGAMLGTRPFLFGSRPSLADFALFGQLYELATDPAPLRVLRQQAPALEHWVRRLDEASGVEGEWMADEVLVSEPMPALLTLIGDTYLPFLAANAEAAGAGQATLHATLRDGEFSQPVFKYQLKCFEQLRARYAAARSEFPAPLAALLTATGCARWLH